MYFQGRFSLTMPTIDRIVMSNYITLLKGCLHGKPCRVLTDTNHYIRIHTLYAMPMFYENEYGFCQAILEHK